MTFFLACPFDCSGAFRRGHRAAAPKPIPSVPSNGPQMRQCHLRASCDKPHSFVQLRTLPFTRGAPVLARALPNSVGKPAHGEVPIPACAPVARAVPESGGPRTELGAQLPTQPKRSAGFSLPPSHLPVHPRWYRWVLQRLLERFVIPLLHQRK